MTAHVRSDILAEIDGPMLRHGIQEMHDRELIVPRRPSDKPDSDALEQRYSNFVLAS